MENIDNLVFKDTTQKVIGMEYLGIHIEDAKQCGHKSNFYFSVPEKSELECKYLSKEDNEKIKTADGLIKVAKETFTSLIIFTCKHKFDKDEGKEFIEYLQNNMSDYYSFYAKIRHGEVWNKEMAEATVQKIKDNNSYQEV